MSKLTDVFTQGLIADRPAASAANKGYYYFASDVSGGTLSQSTGSAWTQLAPGVSGPSSPLLASLVYGPGSDPIYNVGQSGIGAGALDTTNLTISFVVPASGKVSVRATLTTEFKAINEPFVYFAFSEHGTTTQVAPNTVLGPQSSSSGPSNTLVFETREYRWLVYGLTPGATQWDLTGDISNVGAGEYCHVHASDGLLGDMPPITIEVWDAS